jgi:protein-disulfide isomerase
MNPKMNLNPIKEIRPVTRFALPLLMAAIALPSAARAEMTAEQKKEVEALVHQYILEHGDLLIESVNKYQAKQEAEANKAAEVKAKEFIETLKNEKDLAVAGNPNGSVTVVEFFDYNCGYCKKAFEEIQSLVKDNEVRIVLYDMPILGPSSHEISKWALAAKKQNKYFEYHTALMSHNGEKNDDVFKKLAKDAGLDADKLAKDKDDPSIEEEIKKHLAMAQELGIQGTPGFLINEKVFRGYIPYDQMKATIKEVSAAPKS